MRLVSILLTNLVAIQFNRRLLLNSRLIFDEEFPHELKIAYRKSLTEIL